MTAGRLDVLSARDRRKRHLSHEAEIMIEISWRSFLSLAEWSR
jgi:hypothetical protein